LAQSQSRTDVLVPVSNFRKVFQLLVLLTFFVVVLLSLSQIRRSLVPIELLRKATQGIAAKNFKSRVTIETNDEFGELGASFNEMAASLENYLQIMIILNQIGIALSAEKNNNRLLELILFNTKKLTNADGCALYTLTGDTQLRRSVMSIDSINPVMGRADDVAVPLYDKEGQPNIRNAIAFSALKDAMVDIPDMYHESKFDFSHNQEIDRIIGYQTRSLLIVPVKNHENEIMGILQLINAQNRVTREVMPFSREDQRLLQTLASQAAVALSKNKLIEDFKALFDSLVELIATAIDEKSPYTGDHCRRVPELTMMLAEAVSNKKEGVFKDFTLSEEEMYELKVAALLHDCGKVTTPVYIVDKATRLETIFDRIHLIDTRFELLKRDSEIAFLQRQMAALLKGIRQDSSVPEQVTGQALEREELAKNLEQIERDRDLVRACNNGETVMDEDLQERIKHIALTYKWVSADRQEEAVIADDEVYALTSAQQGTLTPAEREVLNKHVETTIKMLEALHYPKTLRNVPLFAQAHHEHMDGRGYPKGLTREQIPVQGRILAIADIFEALTARDRPYKKGKTLMNALCILGSMKLEGQIDPDLFDIFISDKVYLRYAKRFLSHTQIDDVVHSQIPGYVSPVQ
jgi:HD-GYP domain-containing protein (c-di-GMP phosphodiesterase class II)/HAMP domain-containing protein